MEPYQWITLAGTGLAAGLLGGMLGIGGSIIMIPAMVLLCEQGQHLAQGAAMVVNVCVAVPAAVRHFQARAVRLEVVRSMIPAAAIAVVCGVAVSDLSVFHGTGEDLLTSLFGLFLLYVLYRNVLMLIRPAEEGRRERGDLSPSRSRLGGLVVGGLAGFGGGLLGIGGGIIAVPAQQVLLRMPVRNAVANSAATMICLSLIGATYKNYHLLGQGFSLGEPLALAAVLVPGAVVGAYLGGGLTHTVPTRYVRGVLAALILAAAASMLWRGAGPWLGGS